MRSPERFSVRTLMFENGERMPFLINVETGMPDFDSCVFVCTELRQKSLASSTLEQALRSVRLLKEFVSSRGIDLANRFSTGQFLDLHELDDIVRTAYRPSSRPSMANTERSADGAFRKVVDLDRVRSRKAPRSSEKAVAATTVAVRLFYLSSYLSWYGIRAAGNVCRTLEQKNDYVRILNEFLDRLRARIPNSRSTSKREGLTPQQKSRLLEVISPTHPENPWDSEFVRVRNQLFVLWGLGTGLRRGELLGLRIGRLNFRKNMADIVRRPDDKHDSRTHQPNTKTMERSIGFSEELAYITHEYIVKFRAEIRGARKHDFLFVADRTGAPLSLAALSKIFRELRVKHSEIGEALTSHVLRHTWNEDFSTIADSANLREEDERRARNHAMGWSEYSKSADYYLHRRTRRKATATSIQIQKTVINGKKLSRKPQS